MEECERRDDIAEAGKEGRQIAQRQELREGIAADVLRGVVRSLVEVAEVVCARDGRVLDGGEELELVLEALELSRTESTRVEELERELTL